MQGLHLTADLRGCDSSQPVMLQPQALREVCLGVVRQAGLCQVGELFHRFAAPGGITGVVLLAESHLAVHTWPESGSVTLDVYVCNLGRDNSSAAEQLFEALLAAFKPQSVVRQRLLRGDEADPRWRI
jgi:S-adenosylmethionine decarboxylase